MDTKTGTFTAALELRMFWLLSPKDEESFKTAAYNGTTAEWKPAWEPTVYPVNTTEVISNEKEVYPDGSAYVVHLRDGRLQCYYCLILKCVFSNMWRL